MTSPEQQTIPENERTAIPEVLDFLRLGEAKDITDLTMDAAANHNYLVTTREGDEYVVKVAIEETRESLENDLEIQKQLIEAGIGTTLYLQRADGQFIFDQGLNAVASRKIDGIHPEVDQSVSFAIGQILAQYHQAVTTLTHPHQGWLNPNVAARKNSQEGQPVVQEARRLLQEGMIFDRGLPSGIIHGDFYHGNLLANPNNPAEIRAIFDFEEAEQNLFLVDLARTILAVYLNQPDPKVDKNWCDAIVSGYESIRQLRDDETSSLPEALKYVAGACSLWYMNNGLEDRAERSISIVKSLNETSQ